MKKRDISPPKYKENVVDKTARETAEKLIHENVYDDGHVKITIYEAVTAALEFRDQRIEKLREALEDCKPNGYKTYIGETACKIVLGTIDSLIRDALAADDKAAEGV